MCAEGINHWSLNVSHHVDFFKQIVHCIVGKNGHTFQDRIWLQLEVGHSYDLPDLVLPEVGENEDEIEEDEDETEENDIRGGEGREEVRDENEDEDEDEDENELQEDDDNGHDEDDIDQPRK